MYKQESAFLVLYWLALCFLWYQQLCVLLWWVALVRTHLGLSAGLAGSQYWTHDQFPHLLQFDACVIHPFNGFYILFRHSVMPATLLCKYCCIWHRGSVQTQCAVLESTLATPVRELLATVTGCVWAVKRDGPGRAGITLSSSLFCET